MWVYKKNNSHQTHYTTRLTYVIQQKRGNKYIANPGFSLYTKKQTVHANKNAILLNISEREPGESFVMKG